MCKYTPWNILTVVNTKFGSQQKMTPPEKWSMLIADYYKN